MLRGTRQPLGWPTILGLIACGSAFAPALAHAQDGDAQRTETEARNEEAARQNEEDTAGDPDSGLKGNQEKGNQLTFRQ